jgi:hypothetical protein
MNGLKIVPASFKDRAGPLHKVVSVAAMTRIKSSSTVKSAAIMTAKKTTTSSHAARKAVVLVVE